MNGAWERGSKVKYHLISITKSISKILYQTLCVLSQMNIRRGFHSGARAMPQGRDFEALGCPGGQNLFFPNMVMWHIKSTGITSRTECKFGINANVAKSKLVTTLGR